MVNNDGQVIHFMVHIDIAPMGFARGMVTNGQHSDMMVFSPFYVYYCGDYLIVDCRASYLIMIADDDQWLRTVADG